MGRGEYNNTGEGGGNGNVELWTRQNAVLDQITAAEKMISDGERLQNPMYDGEFGSKRNEISITMILQGCEGVLLVISPNLKDRDEGDDLVKRMKRKTGKDSNTYKTYALACNQARQYINQSKHFKPGSPINNNKLTRAYTILKELSYCLKNETNMLGYDFKPKESPYEAWEQ